MFTGIIQNLGKIINLSDSKEKIFTIETGLNLSTCKLGSSISCDGICLTIIMTWSDHTNIDNKFNNTSKNTKEYEFFIISLFRSCETLRYCVIVCFGIGLT